MKAKHRISTGCASMKGEAAAFKRQIWLMHGDYGLHGLTAVAANPLSYHLSFTNTPLPDFCHQESILKETNATFLAEDTVSEPRFEGKYPKLEKSYRCY